MSAKAKKAGRFVCPDSPQPGICDECGAPFPHVVEELVAKGQRIPSCTKHQVKLVPA